ncbi:MAG: leucyl aminopeptidase family protein [Gammaproteobacteria bacterium]|nr:leucyl aminopeptidase family protein [Gammaproteobacteria bacterium]
MTENKPDNRSTNEVINKLGLPVESWLTTAMAKASANQQHYVQVNLVCSESEFERCRAEITADGLPWQKDEFNNKNNRIFQLAGNSGPRFLIDLRTADEETNGMLTWCGDYALARDLMGQLYSMLVALLPEQIEVHQDACSEQSIIGCLAGLEMAAYDYRLCRGDKPVDFPVPGLSLQNVSQSIIEQAIAMGQSTNIARHLVNLPAADLNPDSYADLVTGLFETSSNCQVSIWNSERLQAEKMGLMLAVGKAAEQPPCLIHIRYRNGVSEKKPHALVGKGITFDTGGLDLKPSAFMRMMKKDMGGSAALVGVANWLERSNYKHPVDIWLAVAENAVGQKAFRPGDVITAKNGKTVEIDNTDAEGRLVLADAITVAVTQIDKNKPGLVIDVATLTGAARVALGLQVGALFANDRRLSDALYQAGLESGDPLWPLPLVRAYKNELNSQVAQLVNCSTNRFGGAVTAAMFLAEFTEDVPWAHIDVNAWTNETLGPITGPGGNGQMVQCLVNFLENGFEC